MPFCCLFVPLICAWKIFGSREGKKKRSSVGVFDPPVPTVLLSIFKTKAHSLVATFLLSGISDRRTGGTGGSLSLSDSRQRNHQRGGSLQLPQTARRLDAPEPFLSAIRGSVKMKQNSIQAIKNLSASRLRFFAEAASSRPVEDPSTTLQRISYPL